eukprot:IDg16236t1
MNMVSGTAAEFRVTVAEKLVEVITALSGGLGIPKRTARIKLRSVIRVLAKKAGMSLRKDVVVGSVPGVARLVPERSQKADEHQLPDNTLDRLFGGGDPL